MLLIKLYNIIGKELISIIYKELMKIEGDKKTKSLEKWAGLLGKKNNTNSPHTYKILNFTHSNRNAN